MISTNLSTVVVGKNSLAREGLRRILSEDEFTVHSSIESGSCLLGQSADADAPNLIIVDSCEPEHVEAELEMFKSGYPNARRVVLSDSFRLNHVIDAFKNGADGYIVKEISCEALLESLRLVAMGEKVMPSQLARHLLNMSADAPAAQPARNADVSRILSEREIMTLRYLLMGHPNKIIARRLDISEATVKVYVKAILRKLRVSNRTQAAIWAVNNGVEFAPCDLQDNQKDDDMDDYLLEAAE